MAQRKRDPKTGRFLKGNPRRRTTKTTAAARKRAKAAPRTKAGRFKKQARRSPAPKRTRSKGQAKRPTRAKRNPPIRGIGEAAEIRLETDYVDKHSLASTLRALAVICAEKGQHLNSAQWRQVGARVASVALAAKKAGI